MERTINNKNNKNSKGVYNKNSLYIKSILDPVQVDQVRIPGTFSKKSVTIHRHYQETRDLVGTDFAYQLGLNEIVDSGASGSNITSSFYVTSTYNAAAASSTLGTCVGIDWKPLFNLTTGTARDVRLVSAQVRVYSLASALNLTGSIQTCIYRTAPYLPRNTGGLQSYAVPTLPLINSLHPAEAIVNQGDGIYCNYIPSDEDDFAFLAPNTTLNVRHPNGDDTAFIVVIGQGLPNNSQVRMEVDVNFEVIPYPETSLAGLECFGSQPASIPALDIEYVIRNFKLYGTIRNGRSYSVADLPRNNPTNVRIPEKIPTYDYVPDKTDAISRMGLAMIKQVANQVGQGMFQSGGGRPSFIKPQKRNLIGNNKKTTKIKRANARKNKQLKNGQIA